MKSVFKIFGNIVLAVIIGFTITACPNPDKNNPEDLPDLTGNVTLNITAPKVNDIITAAYSDGNGTGEAAWQWFANNTLINGAASAAYTVAAADEGKTIKARVSFANQIGYIESAATAAVTVSVLPTLTGNVTLSNTAPKVGDTVTASYSGGNGTGEATWLWFADDTVISGTAGVTYTVADADEGKTIKARVSYANQSGYRESTATAAVTKPAHNDINSLAGTWINTTGSSQPYTLKITDNELYYADKNGYFIKYTNIEWTPAVNDNFTYKNDYPGGFSFTGDRTYRVYSSDISFIALSADSQTLYLGSSASYSFIVNTWSRQQVILTETVTLNNTTPRVGDTIIAAYSGGNETGTWIWFANNSVISGAAGNTYIAVDSDEGKTIKAQISFADQSGYIESAATSAVIPLANSIDSLIGTWINTTGSSQPYTLTITGNELYYADKNGYFIKYTNVIWTPAVNTNSTYRITYPGGFTFTGDHTYFIYSSDISFIALSADSQTLYLGTSASYAFSVNTWSRQQVTALTGNVTLSNTAPNVGDTITASYSDGNGTGTATWQWFANDTAISGAASNTYTVAAADEGKTIKARVSFANQSDYVESAATSAVTVSTLPTLTGNVTLSNTAPKVGDTITATYSGGNGTGTAAWQWFANDTAISGTTGNTYTAAAADEGKTIKARVSFANQSGFRESATTSAVIKPAINDTSSLIGTWINATGSYQPHTLTITSDELYYVDKDGDFIKYANVAWTPAENNNSTYKTAYPNGFTFTGVHTYSSNYSTDTLSFIALSADGQTLYWGSSVSQAAAINSITPTAWNKQKSALTGTVTLNNTTPVTGDTITATYSGGNGTGTATWLWFANNTLINGTSGNSYTVTAADEGKTIKARVSYANQSDYVESAATSAVTVSTLPALTGNVTLSNTAPKVGDTITATYSGGNGTGTATWLWFANDTVISGTTGNTYTAAAADGDKTIKARVSYANQSSYRESAATSAVKRLFQITFDTELSVSVSGPLIIHRSSANGSTTATLNINNPEQFSSIVWFVNARQFNGNSITLNSANYSRTGEYTITIEIVKNNIPYSRHITLTVAE